MRTPTTGQVRARVPLALKFVLSAHVLLREVDAELDNSGKLEGYEVRDGDPGIMRRRPELLSNAGEVPYVLATERGKFAPSVSHKQQQH